MDDTRRKLGDRNLAAAVLGGVAAIGAAIGGLLYARRDGVKPKATPPAPPTDRPSQED